MIKNNTLSFKNYLNENKTWACADISQGVNGAIYLVSDSNTGSTILQPYQIGELKLVLRDLRNFDHDKYLSYYQIDKGLTGDKDIEVNHSL